MVKSFPWLFYLTGLIIFLLDRFTKYFVVVFHYPHTLNTGAAFGILQGQQFFLIFVGLVVLGALLYYSHEHQWALGFLLGGTLGNLFDRVVYGSVVDFIHVPFFASFNVADAFNVLGVFFLLLDAWHTRKR